LEELATNFLTPILNTILHISDIRGRKIAKNGLFATTP
jgi:hypothetical protein